MEDVTGFYDEFVDYQLTYLTVPNRRLQKVQGHLLPLLDERAPQSALDVGCGIGLMAGWLADRIPRVVGVDISPRSIETAKQLQPRLEFAVCALPEDALPPGPFELITLIDVVEHFPRDALSAVFTRINDAASEGAVVAVNLPSKLFALRRDPDRDQIIDEAVGLDEVIAAAASIGMEPLLVARYGCESANQYAFCAFSRVYDVATPLKDTLTRRLEARLWMASRRLSRRKRPAAR
jgi:SAM-dependent methyltransferase